VYLTAACEYLAAEVLELSGNAARDNHSTFISCRHVMLAIKNDEELDRLLGHGDGDHGMCIIRESSVHADVDKEFDWSKYYEAEQYGLSAFEKRLVQIGRAAQAGDASHGICLVDPRTGLHKGFISNEEPKDDQFLPLPLLDALCKHTRLERMEMARSALTEADRALMLEEGFCAHNKEVEFPGWARPSLMQVHKMRLNEVRYEQCSTKFCFPRDAISLFVREIGQDFADSRFTAEVNLPRFTHKIIVTRFFRLLKK